MHETRREARDLSDERIDDTFVLPLGLSNVPTVVLALRPYGNAPWTGVLMDNLRPADGVLALPCAGTRVAA